MEEVAEESDAAVSPDVKGTPSPAGVIARSRVTVFDAPVHYKKGEEFRVPYSTRTGDASSGPYRDQVRNVVRSAIKAGRLLVSPYMVLRVMISEGREYVPEGGPEGMNGALAAIMSEAEFDMQELNYLAWGWPGKIYKHRPSGLEEALRRECPDIFERIHILPSGPGPSYDYVILNDIDFAMKKTARERLERLEAEKGKLQEVMSLVERVAEVVGRAEHVTTRELAKQLATNEEERADPDGKFKKKIAEALKNLRFTPGPSPLLRTRSPTLSKLSPSR